MIIYLTSILYNLFWYSICHQSENVNMQNIEYHISLANCYFAVQIIIDVQCKNFKNNPNLGEGILLRSIKLHLNLVKFEYAGS